MPCTAQATPAVVWNCATPLLPDYVPKVKETNVGEGVTYLYVGARDLHESYAADALFQQRLDGRRGWYDSTIRLGPLTENNGWVQIEASRWQRFNYAQHVAIAWGMPHSTTSFYKDLPLMLSDTVPHRLGIAVRSGMLALVVDGRSVCRTRSSLFVSDSEPKYFQVREETGTPGRNGNAVVSNIRLKRDSDNALRPFQSHCVLHRFGIAWAETQSDGTFVSRGAFNPVGSTYFTGISDDQKCKT